MINGLVSGDSSKRVPMILEALRSALIRTGLIVLPFAALGYVVADPVVRYLRQASGVTLAAFSLPETFFAYLTLSLSIGVMISLPYLQFKILSVLPRMYPSVSHRDMLVFWLGSVLLFYTGALFSLFVSLPYGIKFLLSYESESLQAFISVKKFVSFCMMFTFGFGLVFELPLIMIVFGWIGLVDAGMLGRYRRYAVLGVAIVSAVLTPTPDLFNMMLMTVPLYLLFEIGLIGMRFFRRKQSADGVGIK